MRHSSLAVLALCWLGGALPLPAVAYLEVLPQPPDAICAPLPDERDRSPDGTTAQERFEARVRQSTTERVVEIASRSRVIRAAGERRTLSPAHEAALKKIEQTDGISAAEIDKLKLMKKEGTSVEADVATQEPRFGPFAGSPLDKRLKGKFDIPFNDPLIGETGMKRIEFDLSRQ